MEKNPKHLFDLDIRLTWHKLSRMYNQKAASYGISMAVGFILLQIDREGTPSTQLGPRMGMEPTSLSRTLKTMEERGLIRRKEDPLDKRVVRIYLTDDGLNARYIARDVVFAFNNKVSAHVSDEELAVFVRIIGKLQHIIDEESDSSVTN